MRRGLSGAIGILLGCVVLAPQPALAQARTPASPAPQAQPAPAPPAAAAAPLTMIAADTTPTAVPTDLLLVRDSGLKADDAGKRAAKTSWAAKASFESLRGAAARLDSAWANFLPRLSALGRYTRLSYFDSPKLNVIPPGALSAAQLAALQQNLGTEATNALTQGFSIPFFVLDNWLLQGTITVPISDYFLRINQNYSAATHSQEAAQWDLTAVRAGAESNGRLAYYTWLNSRGAVIVATEAFNDQKTHLKDARNQFAAGNASKADVLRAETAVAAAELAVEQAKNLTSLAESQLRVAMHAPDEEVLVPGEDLESTPAPIQGNLQQMVVEAHASRPELRSATANAAAARELAAAAGAGRYPQLAAFGDGILGNPNPRYIPPTNTWNATWDFGAQITWSPNDFLVSGSTTRDVEARVANIEANVKLARDNIQLEVTQALQGVQLADFSIDTGKREQAAAEEAYRVAHELFANGRGTSTTLADAESDLTRARLDLLNARVAARTARIRLEHALGRDAR